MDPPLKGQESRCLHLADIRCSEAEDREATLKGVEGACPQQIYTVASRYIKLSIL